MNQAVWRTSRSTEKTPEVCLPRWPGSISLLTRHTDVPTGLKPSSPDALLLKGSFFFVWLHKLLLWLSAKQREGVHPIWNLPNSLAHMCSRMASVFISLSHGGQTWEKPADDRRGKQRKGFPGYPRVAEWAIVTHNIFLPALWTAEEHERIWPTKPVGKTCISCVEYFLLGTKLETGAKQTTKWWTTNIMTSREINQNRPNKDRHTDRHGTQNHLQISQCWKSAITLSSIRSCRLV